MELPAVDRDRLGFTSLCSAQEDTAEMIFRTKTENVTLT